MKQIVQGLLSRLGLYQRLRGSALYDLYWQVVDPRVLKRRAREIAFYRTLLRGLQPGGLIIDVGANHGFKTDVFLRLGATVVAVEPDDENQRILAERFRLMRLRPKPVAVIGMALSESESVEIMWVEAPGSAKNTLSRKWVDTLRSDGVRFGTALQFARQREVRTTTLERLISQHGPPYYVKVDVEGFEPQVLRGLHSTVPFLSFEINLPEFLLEGLECVAHLVTLAESGLYNYTPSCESGLVLEQWVNAAEIVRALRKCTAPSVEVFWRVRP